MAGTTSDKLQAVLTSKERIRTAIEAKGVSCGTDTPFSQYGEKILSIETGSSGGIVCGAVGVGGQIFGARVSIVGVGRYVKETIE